MGYALQQLINGLTLGATYGLIAIGYTMVYGIIGMINFAHGEIYMIGAFLSVLTYVLCTALGIGPTPLVLLAMLFVSVAFTALYGWAVERIGYRPLRGAPRLAPLISAIGMSIFLQNYVQLTQGARIKAVPPLWQGGVTLWSADDFRVTFGWAQLTVVVVTLIVMAGFAWMITRTSFGRQQRACEQDPKMAALLGIDVDRTISLTFILGAALAAVAGMMAVLQYGVIDFSIGFIAGIKAFTAAVLGGIGSIPGAMLGGLLIGLVEAFWSAYLSPEYKDVATFSILVLVLLFRPTGLLGKPDVEKV
ncbi:branched-chain amino acid ABC transporter permease LivH [Tepidiphilus sp. J10]|uniref:ABC transporter permease subunit n=1 Tax=Tepidiphilus sp. J10 TaxID=2502185 RepID=UPI00115D07D7|nr:branched-chain amino acid ABC transporter permease LivH [Tepidiphilus sp. J10]